MTTNEYIRGVKDGIWLPFDKTLWQRNYYDHIVRNEKELDAIRTYIHFNPEMRENDQDHVQNIFAVSKAFHDLLKKTPH